MNTYYVEDSARPAARSAAESNPSPPRATHARRPELDWLRTIIVLAIIPYHALLLFVTAGASVITHPIPVPMAPALYNVVDTWGISLIFLLAGAASRFALQARSPRAYLGERIFRLAIPSVLVALLFTPLQAYFLLLSNPRLVSVSPRPIHDPERLRNIGAFFIQYWTSIFTSGVPIVVRNPLAHLWFVPRLLIVSLICLPLLLFLRRDRLSRISRITHSRLSAALFVLAAGLLPAAVVLALKSGWLQRLTAFSPLTDNWSVASLDLIMFVYGYLLYSSPRLLAAARRLAYLTLAAAVVSWAIILPIMLNGLEPPNDYSMPAILYALAQTYAMWLLSLAALGMALRYLAVAPSLRRYLTPATFPVYVLHMPLLIITAYYLQALPVPWYVQLALTIIVAGASAFAVYEFIVRRTPVTRFLVGLGAQRPARGAT